MKKKPSKGFVAILICGVVMLAAIALFCIAFETAGDDEFGYWVLALALGFVGVFPWASE